MAMTVAPVAAHPLAELVPPMSEDEYRELRDDIAANGLREPITVYDGQILDGRHRAKACEELGVEPIMRRYEGDEPLIFVISMNVHRRHLRSPQRAEIARQALPHLREKAKLRQREHAGTAPGRPSNTSGHRSGSVLHSNEARERAGQLVGVSGRSVAELDRVAREAPDLHAQVLAGKRSLRKAWSEVSRNGDTPPPTKPPRLPNLDSKRDRQLAAKAKERVERAVGNCNALARGLEILKIETAMAVADPDEIKGWDSAFQEAGKAIRGMRRRIQIGASP